MGTIDKAAMGWTIAIVAFGVGLAGLGNNTPDSFVDDSSVRAGSTALQQSYTLGSDKPKTSMEPITTPKTDTKEPISSGSNDLMMKDEPVKLSNYLKYSLQHHLDTIVETIPPTEFQTKDPRIIYENTGKSEIFVGVVFHSTPSNEFGDIFVNKNYVYPILGDYPTFLSSTLLPGESISVAPKSSSVSGVYEVAIMKPTDKKIINGVFPFYPVPLSTNYNDGVLKLSMQFKSLNADKNSSVIKIYNCPDGVYNKSCDSTDLGNVFDKTLSFEIVPGGAIFGQSILSTPATPGPTSGSGISRGEATIFFSERAGLTLATKG